VFLEIVVPMPIKKMAAIKIAPKSFIPTDYHGLVWDGHRLEIS